jgi:catechol 2,3-dioxygenase-like lactoylglutathione lyase family enzyme
MIDHLKLFVADVAASRAFYEAALEPLGYRVMFEYPEAVGMGRDFPDFWLQAGEPTRCHVAFRAGSQEEVQRFHTAALGSGGTDNGEPGLRPRYHQNYYGAFALDPDGNNAEAVYHGAMQPD